MKKVQEQSTTTTRLLKKVGGIKSYLGSLQFTVLVSVEQYLVVELAIVHPFSLECLGDSLATCCGACSASWKLHGVSKAKEAKDRLGFYLRHKSSAPVSMNSHSSFSCATNEQNSRETQRHIKHPFLEHHCLLLSNELSFNTSYSTSPQ